MPHHRRSRGLRFGWWAGVDELVHHLLDALLTLHHGAAIHHAERLIGEAHLGRWQRDAIGGSPAVAGRRAHAKLLSQELKDADTGAAVGFQIELLDETPVIGVSGMNSC